MDNINREIRIYIDELKSRVGKLDNIEEIKELIANYEVLKIEKKSTDKCEAFTSNGKQCSRKKKGLGKFCGIHEITPNDNKQHNEIERINIQGIYYYIDKTGNVYSPKDMMEGKETKIGKIKSM
jgi:hypothetical protein